MTLSPTGRSSAKTRLRAAAAFLLGGFGADLSAGVIVFNDDGCWNWLQDERAVVAGDQLIIGSVAAGTRDRTRMGDVEAVSYDLKTGEKRRFTLHHATTPATQKQWYDDHNCPALVVRPDGRVLASYAQHGRDEKLFHRLSGPSRNIEAWEDERLFSLPANARVTFPNLHLLPAENGGRGRFFNFFRGLENRNMPSWASSDDGGRSWSAGNVFITVSPKTIPYVKYANNGRDTVHLAFTDGHRINYNNGVHHVFYRDGMLHRSDGTPVRSLKEGLQGVDDATLVFQANPESIAMISDLRLDPAGRPHVVYSVQKDTASLRPRPVGADHRYRYARWTGTQWVDHEIAHGGQEVHAVKDDDCTGLIALDPADVNTVYISTDVDPVTGAALISAADHKRHWEIFRGRTADGGAKWTWTALTKDSVRDNIRPVVPTGMGKRTTVIWLRGMMRLPDDYEFEVVGLISDRS